MLTIYKASAGSGKTFSLTYEYIKSLLGIKNPDTGAYCLNSARYAPAHVRIPNRHRGILAITFTNAATEEMKTRIVRQLASLATPAAFGSTYSKWLMRDFGCSQQEVLEAASKALAEILYDYGSFNVSTIDSFFQGVLRTFSREVDHQGDYELQLDTDLTLKLCVAEMLDRLNYMADGVPPRLVDWIQTFSLDNIRQGKGYNTFSADGAILNTLARNMAASLDESYTAFSQQLRAYMQDHARLDTFSAALAAAADTAEAPAREAAAEFRRLLRASGVPSDLFQSYLLTPLTAFTAGRRYEIKATFIKIATGELPPKKCVVETRRKAAGIDPAVLEPICEALARFCAELCTGGPKAALFREIRQSLGRLDFFCMTVERLEEYLRENNTMLISDTGELLSHIISDAEVPFIYERIGMRLDTLLIDEFQDTSHLQWNNLRPLVANSLAEGNDNLIIGDEKQAIYRFRNSDSALLGHVVQERDFPRDHRIRGFEPADNTNHRSAGLMVRFNNTLFARMAPMLGAGSYGNVVQAVDKGKDTQPAYIRLDFSTDNAATAADAQHAVLAQMARDILRQHRDGRYPWRQILILCRQRKEAAAVVDFLTREHPEIPVLSSEALLLSSSSAVRAIMSMLRLVEGSYSAAANGGTDGSERFASNSDIVMMITRFNYYSSQGADAGDALRQALDSSGDSIEAEIKAIRAENPANLVALIDAIIYHKLSPAQRTSEQAYITALQDLAIKHTEGPDPSIAAFLKAWQTNIDKWAIKASAEIDAVEVMTVHKSKGLERDCVHIPMADWELNHRTQSLWLPLDGFAAREGFDPEIVPPAIRVTVSAGSALCNPAVSPFAPIFASDAMLERIDNLNSCYVAFTRASRELCVHSGTGAIGRYIRDALMESSAEPPEGMLDTAAAFTPANDTFTFGTPTVFEPHTGDGAGKLTVAAGPYTVLYNTGSKVLASIDDALSTDLDIGTEEDKQTVDYPYTSAAMQRAAERGNVFHSILAKTLTLDALAQSARRQCIHAGVPEEEADSYIDIINDAVKAGGDLVNEWFRPDCKIYAERAIYSAYTDDIFRPDRIVVYPDGSATVVDYKFTSEARPSHFTQVENYLTLMRGLGFSRVKGFLWYPLLKKIKQVREKHC